MDGHREWSLGVAVRAFSPAHTLRGDPVRILPPPRPVNSSSRDSGSKTVIYPEGHTSPAPQGGAGGHSQPRAFRTSSCRLPRSFLSGQVIPGALSIAIPPSGIPINQGTEASGACACCGRTTAQRLYLAKLEVAFELRNLAQIKLVEQEEPR